MIKHITDTIRIATEPLNWIVQKKGKDGKWGNNRYFDKPEWMLGELLGDLPAGVHESIQEKFKDMTKDLGIMNEEDQTAYYLTKILKHPEFCKKMHPSSLKNIKNKAISSSDFQRKKQKGINMRYKVF